MRSELRWEQLEAAAGAISDEGYEGDANPGEWVRVQRRGLVVVPITEADGWQAGRWRRELAAGDVTLWQAGRLIAAAAVRVDAVLTTGNPKYFPMAGVAVEHWPVGEQRTRPGQA